MGFLSKMKAAVSAVTGSSARVTLEYNTSLAFPGDNVNVKITATSAGAEVKSKGAFIDLLGCEDINIPARSSIGQEEAVRESNETLEQSFTVAPAFTLAPNETKTFEGTFQIPTNCAPSYQGKHAKHEWTIRGRIEAFGNDPDSGFLPFRVGLRN
jgi:sporulation-control protein spo0M